MFGQELNPESYAICKGGHAHQGAGHRQHRAGEHAVEDGHAGRRFDYMLSNPPFGVEWKKVEKQVRAEHEQKGFDGRFGPGLPRVSDGSLLFLMHLLSKIAALERGRLPVRHRAQWLSAVHGRRRQRRERDPAANVLENDLVEAIVALPTDMFYNTGISTYVWVLSNKKPEARSGKVQ